MGLQCNNHHSGHNTYKKTVLVLALLALLAQVLMKVDPLLPQVLLKVDPTFRHNLMKVEKTLEQVY